MITRDTVTSIAKLARLEFSDAELDQFTQQMGQILEFVEKLNQLDTQDIEATSHAIEIATPMRSDETKASAVIEDVIQKAPDAEEGFFRVPKVI